jgi:copper transport protein
MILRRLLLAALATSVLLVALAGPASAHAILRATNPADGEVLDEVPDTVSLEFNEPVSTSAGGVRVFNAQGARVDAGDAETPTDSLESVEVSLRPDLPDGTYIVSWRALSADAHPVHGAFVFTAGEATADDAVISQILRGSSDSGWQTAATVLRFLQYAAALIAAGGVFFLVWVHDRAATERAPLTRVVFWATVVVVATILAGFVVQAALVTGLGVASALDATAVSDVAASTFGVSSAVLLLGSVLLLAAARRLWDDWAVVVASVGAVVMLGAFALTGHTATSQPRWLVMTADVTHTLAAATWFGGLVLLLVSLRRRRAIDDPVGGGMMVSRFSSLAGIAVAVVSLAGFALGWVEVRALRALWSTGYGVTLLVKLGAVAAVLAIGAYNNRSLVPAIRKAGEQAWGKLRSTVQLEVAGLIAVVAVTAVLVNLVPARDAAGLGGILSVRRPIGDGYQVDITVDPNRVGRNEMHIYLFSDTGRPADAEEITVGLSMPADDIGPIEREPTPTGPGHWTLTAAELPIAGRWIVTIDAAVSDFDQATVDIPIDVGG